MARLLVSKNESYSVTIRSRPCCFSFPASINRQRENIDVSSSSKVAATTPRAHVSFCVPHCVPFGRAPTKFCRCTCSPPCYVHLSRSILQPVVNERTLSPLTHSSPASLTAVRVAFGLSVRKAHMPGVSRLSSCDFEPHRSWCGKIMVLSLRPATLAMLGK